MLILSLRPTIYVMWLNTISKTPQVCPQLSIFRCLPNPPCQLPSLLQMPVPLAKTAIRLKSASPKPITICRSFPPLRRARILRPTFTAPSLVDDLDYSPPLGKLHSGHGAMKPSHPILLELQPVPNGFIRDNPGYKMFTIPDYTEPHAKAIKLPLY